MKSASYELAGGGRLNGGADFFEQRALGWLATNGFPQTKEAMESVATLLRTQDRDSRRACADAVWEMDASHKIYSHNWIKQDQAIAVCLNATCE